jgi:AraC-like DNA-binding protein
VIAAYARLIARVVEHWRVPSRELFAHPALSEVDLSDPFARLPIESMVLLIERARALTREPGLGWYVGVQARISMYGYLGFSMLSASTVREAIELLTQFNPLLGTVLTLRLEVARSDGKAAIVIEENTDLGSARDFILGGVLVSIWHIGFRLSGATPTGMGELMIPEPGYFQRITRYGLPLDPGEPAGSRTPFGLGPPVRFGQSANRLVFDRAKLDVPLLMSDEGASKLAREQCERALGTFASSLVERVRRVVSMTDRLPSVAQVAAELHVSSRTLKRRLAEQGHTFSALSAEARCDKARLLLRSTRLSIAEIADRFGYSSPTNFDRAFRSWTGTSPAAYRRRVRSGGTTS